MDAERAGISRGISPVRSMYRVDMGLLCVTGGKAATSAAGGVAHPLSNIAIRITELTQRSRLDITVLQIRFRARARGDPNGPW